ncbi:MAG: RNHCP domain-containing protein [Patescibacteria group bacterium]|jgi:rubrerythrin
MAFIKKVENFKCEHCGAEVKGSGYTNHCPKCLWSKHVDIEPGDRRAECGGLMRPIDLYYRGGKWIVSQRCESCGFTRNDKIREEDDTEEVIRLEKELAEKKLRQVR